MWSNVQNWVVTFVPNNSKLSKYRAKRDFTKTAEPTGQTKIAASNRRRFNHPEACGNAAALRSST
jgi:hypothetical protein